MLLFSRLSPRFPPEIFFSFKIITLKRLPIWTHYYHLFQRCVFKCSHLLSHEGCGIQRELKIQHIQLACGSKFLTELGEGYTMERQRHGDFSSRPLWPAELILVSNQWWVSKFKQKSRKSYTCNKFKNIITLLWVLFHISEKLFTVKFLAWQCYNLQKMKQKLRNLHMQILHSGSIIGYGMVSYWKIYLSPGGPFSFPAWYSCRDPNS